jgi:hypothetical protein
MYVNGRSEHVLQKYKKVRHMPWENRHCFCFFFFTSLGKSHAQNYSTFQPLYIQHVPNLNRGHIWTITLSSFPNSPQSIQDSSDLLNIWGAGPGSKSSNSSSSYILDKFSLSSSLPLHTRIILSKYERRRKHMDWAEFYCCIWLRTVN